MHSSLCDLEVNRGLHSFCICSRHLMLHSLICRLSLWPVSSLPSVIMSSRPSIIFTVTSHLHTSFSVVNVLAEEHGLFLQHFHVCYKQQRTLFTERVKPLLSNLFQSESTTFLLGSKALARYHSLIFLFSFFPLSWWPFGGHHQSCKQTKKHPAKSCFPSVAWPRLWPLCCLLWRPQMFWSWFLTLFF